MNLDFELLLASCILFLQARVSFTQVHYLQLCKDSGSHSVPAVTECLTQTDTVTPIQLANA